MAEKDTEKPKKAFSLRTKIIIGILTAALGFGIVIQVREIQTDDLALMRQDDLVQLLDEVTRRNEDLTAERTDLRSDRSALQSGSDQSELLKNYGELQSILAGTTPVHGPGVEVIIEDPSLDVGSHHMVHMLEELRNAGAEAISVNDVRLVAGSYFIDAAGGVFADGELLEMPYRWKAIGNSSTLTGALDIPGGALAGFRNAGASVEMIEHDDLQIDAVRSIAPMEFATPNPETK